VAPVLVLAVPHESYVSGGKDLIDGLISRPGVLVDVKAVLRDIVPVFNIRYWSL